MNSIKIAKSSITGNAKKFIEQKLIDLANKNNIRILLAIESGSRAWGFPSKNSDYDVRFVYARSIDDYLLVKPYRDVIETDIEDESFLGVPLDLNGWDIKKALYLATKSNAVLIEWLKSPIKYCADTTLVDDVLKLTKDICDLKIIENHYYKLATNTWKQIELSKDKIKFKLYCYALRPTLALRWIRKYNEAPPMDMKSLCNKLITNNDLYKEIFDLIYLKAAAKESTLTRSNQLIDSFMKSTLDKKTEDVIQIKNEEKIVKANKLFRKIIGLSV